MLKDGKILVGKGEREAYILPQMANRHGLIAGATGTGKTITLKVMAESFSELGVPVFLADVKVFSFLSLKSVLASYQVF